MTEYTRDTMPRVPDGMIRRAEYGEIARGMFADGSLLDEAIGDLHNLPTVRLMHYTRGYRPAGSCAVWREECWTVTWDDAQHNTTHGNSYTSEQPARERFAALTDPVAVADRRAESERMEREVYAPARAAREREAARFAAEKRAYQAAKRKLRRA